MSSAFRARPSAFHAHSYAFRALSPALARSPARATTTAKKKKKPESESEEEEDSDDEEAEDGSEELKRRAGNKQASEKKKEKEKKDKKKKDPRKKKKGLLKSLYDGCLRHRKDDRVGDEVRLIRGSDAKPFRVNVLKPCLVQVLRMKVAGFLNDGLEENDHVAVEAVALVLRGGLLRDADLIPELCYRAVAIDAEELPNEIWVTLKSLAHLGALRKRTKEDSSEEESSSEEKEEEDEDEEEESVEGVSQRGGRRRKKSAAKRGRLGVGHLAQIAAFDLAAELELLQVGEFAEVLHANGFGDRGVFAALTDDVLAAGPLYIHRRARRKISALAEVYRVQDSQDGSVPKSALSKMKREMKEESGAYTTDGETFFSRRSEVSVLWENAGVVKEAYELEVKTARSAYDDEMKTARDKETWHQNLSTNSTTTSGTVITMDPTLADPLGDVATSIASALTTGATATGAALTAGATGARPPIPRVLDLSHSLLGLSDVGRAVPADAQEKLNGLLHPLQEKLETALPQSELIARLVEVISEVFANPERDAEFELMLRANDFGKSTELSTVSTQSSTASLRKQEREKAIWKLARMLFENVRASQGKIPSMNVVEKAAVIREYLAKQQQEAERLARQRSRPAKSPYVLQLHASILKAPGSNLDAFDLPPDSIRLRIETAGYCCEKHSLLARCRSVDIAEAHRDIAEREVALLCQRAHDRGGFSPSYDELYLAIEAMLSTDAVARRNGNATAGSLERLRSTNVDLDQKLESAKAADRAMAAFALDDAAQRDVGHLKNGELVAITAPLEEKVEEYGDAIASEQLKSTIHGILKAAECRFPTQADVFYAATFDEAALARAVGQAAAAAVVAEITAEDQAIIKVMDRRNSVYQPNRDMSAADPIDLTPSVTDRSHGFNKAYLENLESHVFYRDLNPAFIQKQSCDDDTSVAVEDDPASSPALLRQEGEEEEKKDEPPHFEGSG